MASGARPSSNQRSETPSSARKARNVAHGDLAEFGLIQCVICSSRACSHRYYGVAACHGCKCFFWRTVKHQQQYVCRYNKNCEINMDHRNACRYCRFQRCLTAGMQPEAVRVQADPPKSAIKRVTEAQQSDGNASQTAESVRPSDEEFVFQPPLLKKAREEHSVLIQTLLDIDQRTCEEADFSENEAPKRMLTLEDMFDYPEYMDCYRTRINYCIRLRRVTAEEMEFCKYRTLTKAMDYIRQMETLSSARFGLQDKVALLRYTYAPLTIFDITSGTVDATKDGNLLCLPTGLTLSRHEDIVSNSCP
jgi:nuclear factor 4